PSVSRDRDHRVKGGDRRYRRSAAWRAIPPGEPDGPSAGRVRSAFCGHSVSGADGSLRQLVLRFPFRRIALRFLSLSQPWDFPRVHTGHRETIREASRVVATLYPAPGTGNLDCGEPNIDPDRTPWQPPR